jgi:hypothetical protein
VSHEGRHVGARFAGREQTRELDPEQPELNIEGETVEPGRVEVRIREQGFENVRAYRPAIGVIEFLDRDAKSVAVIFLNRQPQSDARTGIGLRGIRIIVGVIRGDRKRPAQGLGGYAPARRGDRFDREIVTQRIDTGKVRLYQSKREQPVQ